MVIANIIIKTSNRNFAELKVSVTVRDGSEDYPFLIANASQLANIGNGVFGYDKHYELQGDVTLGDLGEYYRWTPIGYKGSQITEFTGSFNGNGYTIDAISKELRITKSEVEFVLKLSELHNGDRL